MGTSGELSGSKIGAIRQAFLLSLGVKGKEGAAACQGGSVLGRAGFEGNEFVVSADATRCEMLRYVGS